MLTEKDYCDYETCVALREVGCRIETEWYIHQPSYERGACYLCFGIPRETSVLDECDYIPRLSLYEAQRWLREKKIIEVVVLGEKEIGGPYYADIYTESGYAGYIHKPCEKYEEALSEGVRASIKILQDEQKENN